MRYKQVLFLATLAASSVLLSGCLDLEKLLQPPQKAQTTQASSLPPQPTICADINDATAMKWLHQDKYNAPDFPSCRWGKFWEVQFVYKTDLYQQGKAYCDQQNNFVDVGRNCHTFYMSALNGDTSNTIRTIEKMNVNK